MKPQQAPTRSTSRALMKKPPLAIVTTGDGLPAAAEPAVDSAREQRIRQAAYAYYEARGRTDGNAMDDWLRAEAEAMQAASDPPSP